MARVHTTAFNETDCIGDCYEPINNSLANLDTAVQSVSSSLGGFRNKVINGNFDIWQRRTSYTGNISTSIVYPAADRWRVFAGVPAANNPIGTYVVERRGSLTAELQRFQANYFQRLTTNISTFGTTPMTSYYGNASIVPGIQNIENAANVLGKTMTVSFWARASTANCKLLSETQIFSNNSSSGTDFWTPTICKVFTVGTAWQKFTHTYTMPTYGTVVATAYDPSGKNVENPTYTPIGSSNMPPLKDWLYQVDFKTMWSRGSNNQHGNHPNRPEGYPDPLSENDFQALLASAESRKQGWIDIAQVQLEEGSFATPFEQRPIGTELALCQRYYEKSYSLDIVPGTPASPAETWNSPAWIGAFLKVKGYTQITTDGLYQGLLGMAEFKVTKRSIPTATVFSPYSGATSKTAILTGGANTYLEDLDAATAASETNILFWPTAPIGSSVARASHTHWVVDAEL
jgi:hypothetical protein